MIKNIHVLISGKVQGVWFRASTKEKADLLNITGWVRNTKEGKVEAVFEGDENKVKEMVEWCHDGSPLANVEDVKITEQSISNKFDGFSIKY